MRNIVITGATGFLGSHLALHWLADRVDVRIVCLARGRGGQTAEARVLDALRRAGEVEGRAAGEDAPALWRTEGRLVVVESGDLAARDASRVDASTRIAPALLPLLSEGEATDFYHCAAAVAFTELQEGAVWNNNLSALESALSLARATGEATGVRIVFNHVSTAYVSGTRQGVLEERIGPRPDQFNNIYEESKYASEERAQAFCLENHLPYRILRPSIIIGHSQTHRTSSRVGFYYCLDLIRQFYHKVTLGEALFFRNRSLKIRSEPGATLNLIPIDTVVAEMLALDDAGPATQGKVFHITNPDPLPLADVIAAISELFGATQVEPVPTDAGMGVVDKLFNKRMKLLNPYLNRQSRFDRSNVLAAHADRHVPGGIIDKSTLQSFARAFYDEYR